MYHQLRAALVLLLALVPCALAAQTSRCDRLRPLPNSALQYKDRGNRCEGFYVADVGVRTLELVSFQQGSMAYRLKPGEQLQVSAPGQTASVNVRAVALPARTYYRMDAVLDPGVTLSWPVADVLLPENLSADRIGVFAWKGSEDAKIFVPVRVKGSSAAPQRAGAVLTVRPSFDVERLKWRSAPINGDRCSAFGQWQDLSTNQVLSQQPVRLSLSLKGKHCIEVAAEAESSNDWSTMQVRVEIPSQ